MKLEDVNYELIMLPWTIIKVVDLTIKEEEEEVVVVT
jgi:hypothetical protein